MCYNSFFLQSKICDVEVMTWSLSRFASRWGFSVCLFYPHFLKSAEQQRHWEKPQMYQPKLYYGPTINSRPSRLLPSDDDDDDDDGMMTMIDRVHIFRPVHMNAIDNYSPSSLCISQSQRLNKFHLNKIKTISPFDIFSSFLLRLLMWCLLMLRKLWRICVYVFVCKFFHLRGQGKSKGSHCLVK